MKTLSAICMAVTASCALGGMNPGAATVRGQVLEVQDVESYTYLRLKTQDGETWAAVSKSAVRKGADVSIENPMVMSNFESKSLKKTFPSIVFGQLGGDGKDPGMAQASPHRGMAAAVGDVHVPKASGPNAQTVADINTRAAELKDKPVQVRGKVVKYNPGIMGKNWLHLQDGSGTAESASHDVLVTSLNAARVGDVVTATGTVRTGRDFGAGYAYKVLVEDASLKP